MPRLEHIEAIEKRLCTAADTLHSNSNYASNEYFLPVMVVKLEKARDLLLPRLMSGEIVA